MPGDVSGHARRQQIRRCHVRMQDDLPRNHGADLLKFDQLGKQFPVIHAGQCDDANTGLAKIRIPARARGGSAKRLLCWALTGLPCFPISRSLQRYDTHQCRQ